MKRVLVILTVLCLTILATSAMAFAENSVIWPK